MLEKSRTVLNALCCGAGASPFSSPNSQHAAPALPLLALQEIMATVQLQDTPDIAASPPASEGAAGQPDNKQAMRGAASNARSPAASDPTRSTGSGQGRKQAPPSPSVKQKAQGPKRIKAGLELDGLRAVFDAEAVFAACQIAGDAVAMHSKLAAQGRPVAEELQASAAASLVPILGSPGGQEPKQAVSAAPLKRAGPSQKRHKYEMEVRARLSDLQGEARLSELVCWGVTVQTVSAALGPRCAVIERVALSLNSAQLISLGAAVLTAHIPGVLEKATPEDCAWPAFPRAEGAEDLGRALTGPILPPSARPGPFLERNPDYDESMIESASLMNSMVTDLDAEGRSRLMPYTSSNPAEPLDR